MTTSNSASRTETTVREITQADFSELVPMMIRAFSEDPVIRYVVPDEREWSRIVVPYYRRVLQTAMLRGYGLTDAQVRGVSIWELPNHRVSLPVHFLELLGMTNILRRNLMRAIRIQSFTANYRPTRSHLYLTYIATDPAAHNRGIGSALLTPMLKLADRERLPIYLECSNHHNIAFYLEHGFNLVDEIRLPDGPSIWPMLREFR